MINALLASSLFLSFSVSTAITEPQGTNPFTDSLAERYKSDVINLYNQGIIGGFPDGEFKPENDISRGAAALMVARALEYIDLDGELIVETSADSSSFRDVYEGTSYYNALIALEENNVIRGNPDGTFGPDDQVTRGAMAIMLSNGFDLDPVSSSNPFNDIGASSIDAVQSLYDYAITTGVSETRYGTDLNMKRSDFAVMVNASMDAEDHAFEARSALLLLEEAQELFQLIQSDELPEDNYDENMAVEDLKSFMTEIELEISGLSDDNPLKHVIQDELIDFQSFLSELQDTADHPGVIDVNLINNARMDLETSWADFTLVFEDEDGETFTTEINHETEEITGLENGTYNLSIQNDEYVTVSLESNIITQSDQQSAMDISISPKYTLSVHDHGNPFNFSVPSHADLENVSFEGTDPIVFAIIPNISVTFQNNEDEKERKTVDITPEQKEYEVILSAESAEDTNGYELIDVDQQVLSEDEMELATLINEYRVESGLEPFRISKSMTKVARSHVNDSNLHGPERFQDDRGQDCNLHSWSKNGDWTPVCYTSDHYYSEKMWDKPDEITGGVYTGSGFEISTGIFSDDYILTPKTAINGWKSSPAHNDVLIGVGYWSNLSVMGVSVNGSYAHVWFGVEQDPAGYFELENETASIN